MTRGERKAFFYCSITLMGWMIFAFFFPNQYENFGKFARQSQVLLKEWRLTYNTFVRNIPLAFELEKLEAERLKSTTYTMIYKREYEQLREYLSLSDQMDPTQMISTGVLINTVGIRDAEILKISSVDTIPQKGFLVAPSLSAVIGKIKSSEGKIADVIPIWNDQFNAQVTVHDQENQLSYPDLALIENKQVINFNPAFPYNPGDDVYLSKYEPGGFALSKYDWTRIGRIGPVKQNEIVEKYGIDYDYSREEILKERYFYIVE